MLTPEFTEIALMLTDLRYRPVILLLCGCLGMAAAPRPLSAQPPQPTQKTDASRAAADPELVTAVEGIAEFRLSNGMKILLFPDVSRPTVTVNLTVFVGSRHEGYGEAGMSHLLEHMLFKGTTLHPDIPSALKQRGAIFNGTTWLDRTNYYETLPASDENLEFALRLEADRLTNSLIRAEDLASEFSVVRSEFESGENSPQRVLMQRMLSAAFEWHGYGRATIGNRSDIERVPVESLIPFYRRYYQPDNVMLVVAGKFNPQTALEMITRHFGVIPRPERQLSTTYTVEPAQDGERLVTVRRVGEVPMAGLVYHVPPGSHPDYQAVEMLSRIMGGEPSGRLYESLVKRRIAASIGGFAFALHDPGVLILMAEAAEATEAQSLLQALTESVESTTETPFTAEEVERARQELLRERELLFADPTRVAIELSEWAAQGDWRLFFVNRDRIEKVTPDDIQRVAQRYLTQTNRTAGLFHPTKESQRTEIPQPPDLAALIGDYRGREAVAQGEEFDPSPEAIEGRLVRKELSSGLKATLFSRKTRGSTVDLRLNFRYGNPAALQSKATAAEYLPEMLMRGTKNRTRQQISDELDSYRAQLRSSGSAGVLTLTLRTTRDNLGPVLAIVEDIVRQPGFVPEELELLREEQLAALSQRLNDPDALAMNTIQRKLGAWPPDDPRYVPTLEEEIDRHRAVTLDDIRQVYSELLGAATGELTVLGDFDAEQTLSMIDRWTADWKSDVPFQRLARESLNNESGDFQKINTPDKADATYIAGMTIPMRDSHEDYPALAVGNFILGGGGLSSRLADRVRQQEGLSYGVQSILQPSAVDLRTVFFVYANSNPANAAQLHAVIQEELKKLVEKGVTQEELNAAVEGYLKEQQLRRTNDRGLASILEAYAFIGRDFLFVADFEAQVRSLTVDTVNAALRRHLHPERLFVVSAGDFEAAPPSEKQPKP